MNRHPATIDHRRRLAPPRAPSGFVALALALASCGDGNAQPARPAAAPVMIRVAAIERTTRPRPVRGTGAVAAKSEVKASFKIGGLIRSITVDAGAPIRRGQLLATLDATEIDAGVEQARQAVTKAARDRARVEQLVGGRAATATQLDDATTGLEIARAQLRGVEFNRAHAVIRAPRDGRVLRRLAEPDEQVGPGQPILVLGGDDQGWVLRLGLADRDLVRLHDGDAASLAFPAWPEAPALRAKVSELASAATPPLGTYEVELKIEPAGRALRAGMIAHATIEPAAGEPVAMIPALALRDGDGRRAAVWVPTADGHATRREVELAFFDGERAAIRRGLDGADRVVTEGAAYLTPTSRVEVVP
jgi:RND family efflux transporter MFP subunit